MTLLALSLGIVSFCAAEPVERETGGEKAYVWDLSDPSDYALNGTTIANGSATLAMVPEVMEVRLADTLASLSNVTLREDGALVLAGISENAEMTIATNKDKMFKLGPQERGCQTFVPMVDATISKISFWAKAAGVGVKGGQLNISVQDETETELDKTLIIANEISTEPSVVNASLNFDLCAGKEYCLLFEADILQGNVFLLGGGNESCEQGSYTLVETEDDDDQGRAEISTDGDIDLVLFSCKHQYSGFGQSSLLSLGPVAKWSHAMLQGEMGAGDKAFLYLRTALTEEWLFKGEMVTGVPTVLELPPSSFIQYCLTLSCAESTSTPIITSLTMGYEAYVGTGSLETKDLTAPKDRAWSRVGLDFDQNGQAVSLFVSYDQGLSWSPLALNDNSAGLDISKSTVRFKAVLSTPDASASPEVRGISLYLSPQKEDGLPLPEPMGVPPEVYIPAAAAAVSLPLLAFGVGTQTGRYAFFKYIWLFFVPLYSKISKENILDNVLRKQIFKYIHEGPGASYSEIMSDLKLKNGVLAHHLKTLEREGLIKSEMDGLRYRRFYPKDMRLAAKEIDTLTWFQLGIFNMIRKNPGITPKELAHSLGKSKQVVNYHLKLMKEAQIVVSESTGKNTRLFPALKDGQLAA